MRTKSWLVWQALLVALVSSACTSPTGSTNVEPLPIPPQIVPQASPVARVVVTPSRDTLTVGHGIQFSASVQDSAGKELSRVVEWKSSDTLVAHIGDSGSMLPKKPGRVIVTASVDGVVGTAEVEVVPVVPSYHFDSGISAEDQKLVRDGVGLAQKIFRDSLKVELSLEFDVFVEMGEDCSYPAKTWNFNRPRIVICTSSYGWREANDLFKTLAVVHEVVHTFQIRREWPRSATAMFMEGVAEVVAFKAVASVGLLSYEKAKGCSVFALAFSDPPVLKGLEASATFYRFRAPYQVSFLALAWLVEAKGLSSILAYDSQLDWEPAFLKAFGLTTDEFYTAFESWRGEQPVPLNNECRYYKSISHQHSFTM